MFTHKIARDRNGKEFKRPCAHVPTQQRHQQLKQKQIQTYIPRKSDLEENEKDVSESGDEEYENDEVEEGIGRRLGQTRNSPSAEMSQGSGNGRKPRVPRNPRIRLSAEEKAMNWVKLTKRVKEAEMVGKNIIGYNCSEDEFAWSDKRASNMGLIEGNDKDRIRFGSCAGESVFNSGPVRNNDEENSDYSSCNNGRYGYENGDKEIKNEDEGDFGRKRVKYEEEHDSTSSPSSSCLLSSPSNSIFSSPLSHITPLLFPSLSSSPTSSLSSSSHSSLSSSSSSFSSCSSSSFCTPAFSTSSNSAYSSSSSSSLSPSSSLSTFSSSSISLSTLDQLAMDTRVCVDGQSRTLCLICHKVVKGNRKKWFESHCRGKRHRNQRDVFLQL